MPRDVGGGTGASEGGTEGGSGTGVASWGGAEGGSDEFRQQKEAEDARIAAFIHLGTLR